LEIRDISRVSEAITSKRMNIDPYCQQNCSPLNVLFSDVQIALISQVLPQLGGVKQGGKNKSSYTHGCRAGIRTLCGIAFIPGKRRYVVYVVWNEHEEKYCLRYTKNL